MKAIAKNVLLSGAAALFVGASLALTSATAVSGASAVQPAKSGAIACSNHSQCLSVRNGGAGSGVTSQGGAIGLSGSTSLTEGFGIEGASSGTDGVGVYGVGASSQSGSYFPAGVAGVDDSPDGYGVYAASSQGVGLISYASGTSSYGVAAINNGSGGLALFGETTNADATPLLSQGPGGYFYTDGSGDGFFSGSVTAPGGYQTVMRARNGEMRGASAALMTQATMEDTGTARLLDGEAAVRFDPAFASTIDASRGYQIFLTPNGDTRGLYVSAKYEAGFIVRENEHGRSSVYFDYRIVAHPHGLSDARLPRVSLSVPRSPRRLFKALPPPRQLRP